MPLPSHALNEGRFAIVTERWAQDAMDASWRQVKPSPDEIAGRVRQSRVVLAPRPWRQACEKHLAGDGGKKRRFTGESTKQPLKPIARGKPVMSG